MLVGGYALARVHGGSVDEQVLRVGIGRGPRAHVVDGHLVWLAQGDACQAPRVALLSDVRNSRVREVPSVLERCAAVAGAWPDVSSRDVLLASTREGLRPGRRRDVR